MTTLNITNGDHAGDKLKTVLDSPVITAADVLHEGACPPVDGDAWYEARARFLAGAYGPGYDETKKRLRETDETIGAATDIVLWFEHDLFDQLILIRLLDLLVRLTPDTTDAGRSAPGVSGFSRSRRAVSLICIGAFPGIDRFIGLGQLTPEQLATLKGSGTPLTAGHYALAADAWRAFRSPDPCELVRIAQQLTADAVGGAEGTPPLVFLGDALLRFLAEYPSVVNGLSRTEQLALEALAHGATTAAALFAATQEHEPRPFMGDTTFFDNLDRLATARVPLITADRSGSADWRTRRIALSDTGRDVLANRADHVRLNGIDVWRGGVHLTGSDRSPWRWDADAETLVS